MKYPYYLSMVTLVPTITVKSTIDALDFYNKIFDAEIIDRVSPTEEQRAEFNLPNDMDLSKMTLHSSFKIGDALLYISDSFSDDDFSRPNVSISIEPDSLEQMKRFYSKAEKEGCKITMKLEKQFWGDYFCTFIDPFGIRWQMNLHVEE